jgi:hypothetical protein
LSPEAINAFGQTVVTDGDGRVKAVIGLSNAVTLPPPDPDPLAEVEALMADPDAYNDEAETKCLRCGYSLQRHGKSGFRCPHGHPGKWLDPAQEL